MQKYPHMIESYASTLNICLNAFIAYDYFFQDLLHIPHPLFY